jgi:hypothetical protein
MRPLAPLVSFQPLAECANIPAGKRREARITGPQDGLGYNWFPGTRRALIRVPDTIVTASPL